MRIFEKEPPVVEDLPVQVEEEEEEELPRKSATSGKYSLQCVSGGDLRAHWSRLIE